MVQFILADGLQQTMHDETNLFSCIHQPVQGFHEKRLCVLQVSTTSKTILHENLLTG